MALAQALAFFRRQRRDIGRLQPQAPGSRRVALAVLGVVAYASLVGIATFRAWPHYELLGIFLRYTVLLPAIVYALRTHGAEWKAHPPHLAVTLVTICAFFLMAAGIGWRVGEGLVIPDESSYRFQALVFASGEVAAPPLPGSAERPSDAPRAIRFVHQIESRSGWYSKYPVGWPAVLAFPEAMNLGWLANPVLGALLLVVIGLAAREAFGPATVLPAVAMAALSPYFLANSVGRMPHALSGVLVASASLLCIQGLKTGKLSRFGWMFLLLAATFHVRPLTALVASVILGFGALIATRAERTLCIQIAALAGVAATLAASSFLLYNWRFTGNSFLSPYALYRGTAIPMEISVNAPLLARNLASTWRFASQSTILYSFPFLALLAIYTFWASRPTSPAQWILLALPCALVLAHLVQFEGSASIIGERYWFEGYFAIVILAAEGLTRLLTSWRPPRQAVIAVAISLVATQIVMMAAAAAKLDAISLPRREMRRMAETYRSCNCVVYFADTPETFYGSHLNLNSPDWPSAGVFYAVDPGPDERAKWAGMLHRRRWVVLKYDDQRSTAVIDGVGSL
jgi:hypothetical protein